MVDEILRSIGLVVEGAGSQRHVRVASDWGGASVRVDEYAGIARFEIGLPALPARFRRAAGALHNAARATAEADYLKVYSQAAGALAVGAEVPSEVLTPPVADGLLRGVAVFGSMTTADLAGRRQWGKRIERSLLHQASCFTVDVVRATAGMWRLLEASDLEPVSLGWDERGRVRVRREFGFDFRDDYFLTTFDPRILAVEPGSLTPFDPDEVELVHVRPTSRLVSLSARVPAGGWRRNEEKLSRLLSLNEAARVAKIGLDRYDGVVILYQVPKLTRDILRHASTQFGTARLGVAEIRTS